ncbi:hypothetical protein N0V86_001887 [Didymella sp. IMI 355093]|nr:hypothetical protein N0V86_001887 [Didymella sp. IMI 355093]
MTDAASGIVKELIENALDARAKSIFVDITANTVDSIQIKDDGHGIPNEGRALACRRYCTSKIRDFHDLKEVGGKWLGFRGEALASIADMSGTVSITTRVEGEPVAMKLMYQRNGELTKWVTILETERDSHPVGTTVRVTELLQTARVRKNLAIKGATKCLTKVRRLMQAYALARPAVRFRLHVLKAKNNKGDFVYAPKANANVEDAALKIVGRECALQCDWTALKSGGVELHAFMPKPTTVGSMVANHGAFISVDARPVSSTRGTFKKIATAVRDRLRKANAGLANVKDPFFCLNIICPVDSYDPNIEPAKDDVVFSDENSILAMANKLLISYYPENISNPEVVEEPEDTVVTKPNENLKVLEPSSRPRTPFSVHKDTPITVTESVDSADQSQPPRWRSSMYGIDEEDLEFLQENIPDVDEDEEGQHDVIISNPWTVARMNTPIKPRKPVSNGQLLSPAKSQGIAIPVPQSPAPEFTPYPRLLVLPAAERLIETRLTLENNTDIRDYFGNTRRHIGDQLREYAEHEGPNTVSPRRPRSADSCQHSTHTAQEMDTLFQLHQNASSDPDSSPIRRSRPSRIASVPAPRSTSRPRRRRTTDSGLHRTKSSTLPLNYTPHGFEPHNLTLPLTTSVSSITQQARKLDMGANTLEWGYDSTDAFDIFNTRTNERKIMQWVIKLDSLLAGVFERRDVEARRALYEGIQRALDLRKDGEAAADARARVGMHTRVPVGEDGTESSFEARCGSGLPTRNLLRDEAAVAVRAEETGGGVTAGPEERGAVVKPVVDVDEFDEEFDFEQFVDVDGDVTKQGSSVEMITNEDDFGNGDGVDDEMLMDL